MHAMYRSAGRLSVESHSKVWLEFGAYTPNLEGKRDGEKRLR